MGDVSGHFNSNQIKPFLKDSLLMAFQGLKASQHHLVRQNSVFTLGCLCRGAGNTIDRQSVIDMIKIFVPLCQLPKSQKESKYFNFFVRVRVFIFIVSENSRLFYM